MRGGNDKNRRNRNRGRAPTPPASLRAGEETADAAARGRRRRSNRRRLASRRAPPVSRRNGSPPVAECLRGRSWRSALHHVAPDKQALAPGRECRRFIVQRMVDGMTFLKPMPGEKRYYFVFKRAVFVH